MKITRLLAIFVLSMLSTIFSSAEIKMPKIFSDGMVLQRDTPIKLWGKSVPKADVGVEFEGQKKLVKADANGNWVIFLDKLEANKNPAEMKILENGKVDKEIKDILVGEVWVLSGQSNMQWSVKNTTDYETAKSKAKDCTNIRFFITDVHAISNSREWDMPEKSSWIGIQDEKLFDPRSAVGYYFADLLTKDLDVPVGLIETALGGSSMRAWIPEDSIEGIPFLEESMAKFKKMLPEYDYEKAKEKWQERKAAFDEKVKQAKAEGKEVPQAPGDVRTVPNPVSPIRPQDSPAGLYNSKIAPIAGFAARGVLWYQGESDSGGNSLEAFEDQFVRMVETWRKDWNNPDLFFIWAQLTSFETKSNWGQTRWSQYNCLNKLKKSAMANIIDIGEEKDIHPRNKTDVGSRMEKIALKEVYGQKGIKPYGPIFRNVKYGANGAEVFFETDGRKLVGKGEPRGFEVLIGDNWQPAKAELLGKKVILKPTEGNAKDISAVRYLWKSWAGPDVWLFNDQGLPAYTFIHQKSK